MGEKKKEKKEKKESSGNGNAFKIVIIALLLIIIIGFGAFAGYYFFFSKNNTGSSNKNMTYTNNSAQSVQGNSTSGNVSALTCNMDEFLVNLADPDGKRYLQVTIYIGYENKKMTKEFTEKKAIIRDAINSVLRAKKASDFTAKGTEDLKVEILNRINPIFENGKADSVYFYNILVQ